MKILNILMRCCIPSSDFEDTVLFYENLMNEKVRLRFYYSEARLQLAQVASVLIIAGDEESLLPYVATNATYYVDSVSEYSKYLPIIGAEIVEGVKQVPTGRNMLVRHPDMQLIEYIEHDREYQDKTYFLSE